VVELGERAALRRWESFGADEVSAEIERTMNTG
jgi:hypothetical protein